MAFQILNRLEMDPADIAPVSYTHLIVPMAFLLSKLWDLTGVWLTFPVTEGLVALFSVTLLWKGRIQ